MSSTYSTNLALELMGAGDQAGNWGATTNTNLGTLIEQAISGYTTQAMADADQTLTMTPGASATARCMFIECTGTLTAARNLIVPSNRKLYFIYNNTSGGYAITVKVSGQTGVSVPASAKASLVSNGTDIVTAQNYMYAPTLANAALTGIPTAPTAAVGTNTTQIATTAFVSSALIAAYPVGSIYMSTVSTNPASLLGFGTWVAFSAGRVLIGDGGGYSAGTTGGSADAITVSHTHTFSATTGSPNTSLNHRHYVGSRDSTADNGGNYAQEFVSDAGSGYGPNTYTNYQDLAHTHDVSGTTASSGSSGTGANLQPYLVVYMWNRTA